MFSFKNKFPYILIIILILGLLSTLYIYSYTKENQLERLTQRATSIALALNSDEISTLKGDETDLNSTNYNSIKNRFIDIKSENPDVTFIYLMGKNSDGYFFYVDSENPNSEDYSPPGENYEDDASDLDYVFENQRSISTFVSDSWGSWISASAPIIKDGNVIAILGIDMDRALYNQIIFVYTLIPVSITIILSIIILSLWFVNKTQNEVLELRSNFVSIAAHDLRSPLTAIRWICELVLKSKTPLTDEEKMNYIRDIDKNSEILMTFIEDLLDATSVKDKKNRKLVKEQTEINSIIDQALSPLELSLKEKNIELIKSKAQFIVNVDRDKMRRVFSNLLSNSIKYSPNDSKIGIDFEKNKNNLIIYIKDQGIGIPKSEQNKILSGYYRAKNAKQFTTHGTGLGLFYCSNVIKLHKGKMKIESEENKGTNIILELPIE